MVEKWDKAIPRVSKKVLSIRQFYEVYMIPNRPVIITDMVEGWGAANWVKPDGTLNTVALKKEFGNAEVTVHNCSKVIKDMGRLETTDMTVGQYLDWWDGRSQSADNDKINLLYLKDWNFCKENPT
jgi:hypothetical protein